MLIKCWVLFLLNTTISFCRNKRNETHHNSTNLNYTGVTLTYDYERGKLEYTKGIPYYCKMKHTTSNLLLLDYTGVTLLMNVATWQSGENIWKWNTVQYTKRNYRRKTPPPPSLTSSFLTLCLY